MKKTFFIVLALVASICPLRAQVALNDAGDNILGVYSGEQHGDVFKARITRQADGTYKGQIFWMEVTLCFRKSANVLCYVEIQPKSQEYGGNGWLAIPFHAKPSITYE